MTIIDSQVHAYEANTPKRPWHSVPNWPDRVTGDEMVAAMDKVGVDGAIFISAFSMYRYDASYAVEVQRAHPGRFAIVRPVDPEDPAVADVVADWKQTPGAVGIRIMMTLARDWLLYYVMASSQTLGDALRRIARYSKVTNEALVFGYREGNRLIINLSYSGVPRHSDRHQIEFCMFAALRICRVLTGQNLVPRAFAPIPLAIAKSPVRTQAA
jgi:hypothetical protein